MITLKKDNIVMKVENDFQASAFLRNGYVRADETSAREASSQTTETSDAGSAEHAAESRKEEPRRRRRRVAE